MLILLWNVGVIGFDLVGIPGRFPEEELHKDFPVGGGRLGKLPQDEHGKFSQFLFRHE